MRLRNKLLILLIPLAVAPLTILSSIALTQINQLYRQNTAREVATLLQQFQSTFNTLLETSRANIELFSQSSQLTTYLLTTNEEERFRLLQPSLMRLLRSYQRAFPEYQEIQLILPDGYEDTRVVNTEAARHSAIAPHHSNELLFQQLQRHSSRTPLLHFEPSDQNNSHTLHVAQRIEIIDNGLDPLTAPKSLRGYLVLTLSLKPFFTQLSQQTIGRSGYIFVIDRQGLIQSHPDHSRIGTHLPLADRLWQQRDGEPLEGEIFGSAAYFNGFQQQGQLMVVAMLPVSDLYAEGNRLTQAVGIIVLLSIFTIILLTYLLFNRYFIRPIEQIRSQMRILGQGRSVTVPAYNSRDELGELAGDLIEMGQQIDASHRQIEFQAYHDPLTSLGNRIQLRHRLQQNLIEQPHRPFALLLIDIDGFKRVNDIMGHRAGDDLLILIARRLQQLFTDDPITLFRLGGDEFLAVTDGSVTHRPIQSLVEAILAELHPPFKVNQQNLFVGACIGVALYPNHGCSAEELMHNADLAMFAAKRSGRNQIVYYHTGMPDATRERAQLELALRAALATSEQLFMVYQAKLDLSSNRIDTVEALIRWQQPEQGLIRPDLFIPVAEECGLIIPLGEWILRTVCRQIVAWQRDHQLTLKVAINISAQQLLQRHFIQLVTEILHESGCSARQIEFELTETSMLSHDEPLSELLEAIADLGITIALDDFGTGYSSLSHLRRFPIHTIKIDRSFIHDSLANPDDQAIVNAIISMSHDLGMAVVAEGVETAEQLKLLADRGCDTIQGYYISRPLTATDLIPFLAQWSPSVRKERLLVVGEAISGRRSG